MAHPRCCRCHRRLKDPASIAAGLGPSCRRILSSKKEKPGRKQSIAGPYRMSRRRGDPDTITLDDWLARLDGGELENND